MTVSIGYAASTPTATVASLLGAADTALYDARNGGRDQVRPTGPHSAPEKRPPENGRQENGRQENGLQEDGRRAAPAGSI